MSAVQCTVSGVVTSVKSDVKSDFRDKLVKFEAPGAMKQQIRQKLR